MKVYFYTNIDTVVSAISDGTFFCGAYKGMDDTQPLGTNKYGFFITAKRLAGTDWEKLNIDVAVELEIPNDKDKRNALKALIVSNKFETKKASFAEYNPLTDIGFFVSGFIPFSYVRKFYVYKKGESCLTFPSPDLWNPSKDVVDISKVQSCDRMFVEQIDTESVRGLSTAISEECKKNLDEMLLKIVCSCRRYEKELAYGYAVVLYSEWDDYYYFKIKPNLFALPYCGDYEKYKGIIEKYGDKKMLTESSKGKGKKKTVKQDVQAKAEIFEVIKDFLMNDTIRKKTNFDENLFRQIIDNINRKECISEELFSSDASEYVSNILFGGGRMLDEIEKLNKEPVFYALLLLFKCPDNFVALCNTLEVPAYKIPETVKNRAKLLFTIVNGMGAVPGEEKTKFLLRENIEKVAMQKLPSDFRKPIFGRNLQDKDNTDKPQIEINIEARAIQMFFSMFGFEHCSFKEYVAGKKFSEKVKAGLFSDYVKYKIRKDVKEGDVLSEEEYKNLTEKVYDEETFRMDLKNEKCMTKLYRQNQQYFQKCMEKIIKGDIENDSR